MIPSRIDLRLDDAIRDRLNAVVGVLGWTDQEVMTGALAHFCETIENQGRGWRYWVTLPGETVHRPLSFDRPSASR